MGESIIKAINVQKEYRREGNIIRALVDINLDISTGEVVFITGPTACGKTTLLNVLSGLDLPDDGQIILDGENIARAGEDRLSNIRRQKIGFVFQDFNLIETLTGIENIEALLWPTVLSNKEIENRSIQALRDVDLLERKDHYPRQMSGGEKQRIAIARAIVHQPRVLFADEPTGNLDPTTEGEIMKLIRKLNEDMGTTMVIVTHQEKLLQFADRVVQMDKGRIANIKGGKK